MTVTLPMDDLPTSRRRRLVGKVNEPGRQHLSALSKDREQLSSTRPECRERPSSRPSPARQAERRDMGLLGMMARTAVVAGTATAVSNRVSRRQVNRWQQKADAKAYEQQAPPEQPPPPQYQQPQYQQPQYQQPAPAAAPNLIDELKRLADLKDQGILSDAEFTAAKSKLLGS